MGIHSNFNLHQVKKIYRQDENPLKMNKLHILILALALITAEAAPQWPQRTYNSGGNTRQHLKTKGAALLGAGIGLKVVGGLINNPGLQQAGGAIATAGAAKKVAAHFF